MAGGDPGPACYGKGGTEPTVTDADVVLGYVPVDHFLGGEISLDEGAKNCVTGLKQLAAIAEERSVTAAGSWVVICVGKP